MTAHERPKNRIPFTAFTLDVNAFTAPVQLTPAPNPRRQPPAAMA